MQVRNHGTRSWLFRYSRNGTNQWMGLGSTEKEAAEHARDEAAMLRVKVRPARTCRGMTSEHALRESDRPASLPASTERLLNEMVTDLRVWSSVAVADPAGQPGPP
jgi:hypothetical protein